MKISPLSLFNKWNAALLAFLKPLGVWGIGGLALIDTASIPLPIPLPVLLIDFIAHDRRRFVLYVIMGATGAALGSMVPYFFGRAGGELFLLKRINRKRYEQLRDRFQKQEFLAIMIPAMMPPPFPLKVFELAAGVFEMRPVLYFSAMFTGKFIQFMVVAIITVIYGPALLREMTKTVRDHEHYVLAGVGAILGLILFFGIRKLFDRRRGTRFPLEDS